MSAKRRIDSDAVTSAREVSDHFGLPFEITAKTLQRLRDSGLIQSAQGARGGYTVSFEPEQLNLADFMKKMEGPQSVVACAGLEALAEESPSVNPAVSPKSRKNAVGRPPLAKDADGVCSCEYRAHCGIQGVMTALNTRVLSFLESISMAEILGEAPQIVSLNTLTLVNGSKAQRDAKGTLSHQNQNWSDQP